MSAVVHSITPHVNGIQAPAPLRCLQGWLIWRFEDGEGDKPRKVPYYTGGGKRYGVAGSTADRAKLSTFDAARKAAAARGYDGVGLAILPEFGITALDFDNCVGPTGLDRQVEDVIAGTYAEYSPSGQGVRAFVRGSLGTNRKSHATASSFGFEVFSTKGFVTFTGNVLDITELTGSENTLADMPERVKALYSQRFGDADPAGNSEPLGLTPEQIAECLKAIDPGMDYTEWLSVGMALHHETGGEGFELWNEWSEQSSRYPNREVLEAKWDGFGRTADRQVTAGTLLKLARDAGVTVGQSASAAEFEVYAPEPRPPGGHFNIRSAADFMSTVKPISWLIKGFLPKATLGVLYGESGSGKSFLAFDVCAALGRGIDWNGQRGRQSRVLYVVAEGVGGFNLRVKAYCHQAGIDPSALGIDIISDVTPNLMDTTSVSNLIADIKASGPYDLIVMDTFAQVTPGANENSGEDMGKALGYCRKISQSTGSMVLLVHHSGKDASKGARGWSGTHAASDVVLEVSRFENDRCVTVTKQKDGQDGQSYGFKLHDVVLGTDEDGDDITSCIVEYGQTTDRKVRRAKVKLGDNERIVVRVAHDLAGFAVDGKVPQTDLIEACVAQIPHEEGKRDRRRDLVMKSITSAAAKELFMVEEGFVQILRDPNA
jgi:hypothetical protein